MKLNTNSIITIYLVLLLILFIKYYDVFASRLVEIFYASIGLLTFTSIFYSFTISKGKEIIEKIKSEVKKEYEEIKKELKNKINTTKEETLSYELESIKTKLTDINTKLNYLNLNKWLFTAVLGYMVSIFLYIMRSDGLIDFIQVLTFVISFYASLIIVTVWFIINYNKDGD